MFTNNKDFQLRYKNYKSCEKIMLSRLQKDISCLDLSSEINLEFPDFSNLKNFFLSINPDNSSFWKNKKINFQIKIPNSYPNRPPKIKCLKKIFHPNIDDSNGGVCLSIIREDWTPVYGLNHIFQGLLSLFYFFDSDDPLNKKAAESFSNNLEGFKEVIRNLDN